MEGGITGSKDMKHVNMKKFVENMKEYYVGHMKEYVKKYVGSQSGLREESPRTDPRFYDKLSSTDNCRSYYLDVGLEIEV